MTENKLSHLYIFLILMKLQKISLYFSELFLEYFLINQNLYERFF